MAIPMSLSWCKVLRLHPILLYLSKYCPILSDSSFESKGLHGSVRLTSLESWKANVKLKQTSLTRIAASDLVKWSVAIWVIQANPEFTFSAPSCRLTSFTNILDKTSWLRITLTCSIKVSCSQHLACCQLCLICRVRRSIWNLWILSPPFDLYLRVFLHLVIHGGNLYREQRATGIPYDRQSKHM